MGRGDKKTKKGKIFMGSFGKSRPVTKKIKAADATKSKEKKEGKQHINIFDKDNAGTPQRAD